MALQCITNCKYANGMPLLD